MTIGATAAAKSTDPAAMTIAVIIISGLILGGLPGSLVGLVIGLIRRSINRPRQAMPFFPMAPQQPYDMWSEQVERCAESARRVSAAVQTVPASAAKDWLLRISEQLTKELDDVRGIAQLGRALGAVDQQHPVYQRLLKAAHDFKQFENEVGRVALQMFDHPELDDARTHLEMLEKQLPQLST
ncbi:hypothetical protein [Lentzea nigeriaca]|uniref:hypothetical protein n=1 Tax=Lentzea nigeriaca TaxID=1128665 RepID=UPI001958298C|nr:hypothetical protein [Lentzea nigeriaca]MBM7861169.1 hypothetical protein [Lentzea nigeriaca]